MKIKLNEQQTKQLYQMILPELIRIEKEKEKRPNTLIRSS
jgi:hypothetical protein